VLALCSRPPPARSSVTLAAASGVGAPPVSAQNLLGMMKDIFCPSGDEMTGVVIAIFTSSWFLPKM
jgi:hypothetical protein